MTHDGYTDSGRCNGAVFLDLAKAFDTVDHSILCAKLTYYGFRGSSYDLLSDYLAGRQQRVLFHGHLSGWGSVSIGVPQGSILGPLLFALYINDLPSVVKHCILDLYADDAELHCSHSDLRMVETYLQSDLDSVAVWLLGDKSNCMLIGSHQRVANKELCVSVGGNVLTQVNSVRYLGVLIDPVLSWTLHINTMASRIRSRLSSILCYGSLPPALLCLLYSAFVMPLYDYCNIIWSPSTAKQTRMLERIHSKFVNRLPLPYRSRFSLTLTECRRFHTAIQIFRSLH